MKKQMLYRLLALLLALTLLAGGASAQTVGSLKAVRTYDGRFTDVPESAWYSANVKALYELGITDGRTETTFAPGSGVKVAEVVAFAARIYSAWKTGDAEQGAASCDRGGRWYEKYASWLQAEDLLDNTLDARMTAAATREETAHILYGLLTAMDLPEQNADTLQAGLDSGLFLTDIESSSRAAEIEKLYACGIAAGSDSLGSFHPDSSITRAELAAMLTRIADPDLRVSLSWDPSAARKELASSITYESLLDADGLDITQTADPNDTETINNNMKCLLANGITQYSFYFTESVSSSTLKELTSAYAESLTVFIEQGYNQVKSTRSNIAGSTIFTITISDGYCSDRAAALQKAIDLHLQMWDEGKITTASTQKEIAEVYAAWLAAHVTYDSSAVISNLSYTAEGALIRGKAVCQGYTAAMNLLLKIEGIECSGFAWFKANHVWTVAVLDGTEYHVDTTWADGGSGLDRRYLLMTATAAKGRF